MLTIFNDPAGVTGRRRVPLDHGISLQANIERHLSGGEGAELRINGQTVDPLTDPRLDRPPSRFDEVVVVLRPAGLDPFTWVLIAVVASVAITYSLIPSVNAPAAGKQSPNNDLTAQRNVARAYQAIPDVYGLRRVWPDLIQPSTVEYIDHVKFVTEWLCVSRGKGTLTDVRYAETPIDDITGASFEVFEPVGAGYPEDGVTTLTDVFETFECPDVNGQELVFAGTIVGDAYFEAASGFASFTLTIPDDPSLAGVKDSAGSGTVDVAFTFSGGSFSQTCTVSSFTVIGDNCEFTMERGSGTWAATYTEVVAVDLGLTDPFAVSIGPFTLPVACTRIRWNTIFQRGLKGSAEIKAEWWQIDGAGVEIPGTRENETNTYTANTYDARYYTNEVTPTAGQGTYRIQFTRMDEPRSDGLDVAKLEEVYAVRYYAEKELPGVTVVRVTTKATEQATGFSERRFNLRFARHVRTLTTDTLSASRNFARAMAHIWTLTGGSMSELDVAGFQAINTEFGEDDELLRFDYSFDDRDMSLGERLQVVANHARCVLWRDGTVWTVTRDQARQYPELQLDYRNLAARGESAISVAAHLPASHDGIELEFVDEATQSKKAYVRLNVSTGAVAVGSSSNPKKIALPGCTTTAQAENRARLEARKLLYQRVSVSDTALSDALILGPGSLVRWIDPNDFAGDDGLQAGEVLSIAGSTITTSEPLDWKGYTSGRILFTGINGERLAAPVICSPVDGGVLLASVPAGLFVKSSTRQLGSRYAFAVGLTDAELEAAGLYTVTEIRPTGGGECSLACAVYDDRIYADD